MKYIYEFIGTFFLMLTIGMTVLEPHSAKDFAPIAIGTVLAVMVYAGGLMSTKRICAFIVTCIAIGNLVSAEDALEILKQGNQRFVENRAICDKVTEEKRLALAKAQKPIATLIVCSDSRVPPEQVFDQNIGQLFVVRLAGNVVDQFALASIEYGVSVLKTPLVIVMGHQNCGAVKEAFTLGENEYSANIASLLTEIYPSVRRVKGEAHLSKAEQLKIATQYNVENTRQQIILRSPVIKKLVDSEEVQIVDAMFFIDTGKVEWGPFTGKSKTFWQN